MELKYYINTTQISEPIGFDDFKTVLKRTEQHGISAESSVGSLEFYGNAFDIIKAAYATDIDTELIFKFEKGTEIEQWVIDLSTYNENITEYCSCTVKVGEIGVKTTFNNRIDTKVDVNSLVSLDGAVLDNTGIITNLEIPSKGLKYETKALNDDTVATSAISYSEGGFTASAFVSPFGIPFLSDLSGFLQGTSIADQTGNNYEDYTFFIAPETNAHYIISIVLKLSVEPGGVNKPEDAAFQIKKNNGTTLHFEAYTYPTTGILTINETINLDVSLNAGDRLNISMTAFRTGGNGTVIFKALPESQIYIYLINTRPVSNADTLFVFNAFKKIVNTITNLSIKSDWYSLSSPIGGGALKAITTGLWLRNAVDTSGFDYKFEMSFKELFKNLNAIDNIGWGFSKENTILQTFKMVELTTYYQALQSDITFTVDISSILKVGDFLEMLGEDMIGFTATIISFPDSNTARFSGDVSEFYADNIIAKMRVYDIGGIDYLRVERWQWFYKSDILLTINNPANKKRIISPDRIYSRLNIGYDKYGNTDELNSMDTFHTKREYSTKLKSVDNELNAISKFIACPYAIEFTRRKALDKTTEDWKYDENIFVLCVGKLEGNYSIEIGLSDSNGSVISPDTLINARISPLRNAIRHGERFFEVNRSILGGGNLYLLSSTGNVNAEFKPFLNYDDVCEDSLSGLVGTESDNIPYIAPELKPEILSFEYPVCKADFDDIRANPYGIITVDGEDCYIQEITRQPLTGMCEFKLIPKII